MSAAPDSQGHNLPLTDFRTYCLPDPWCGREKAGACLAVRPMDSKLHDGETEAAPGERSCWRETGDSQDPDFFFEGEGSFGPKLGVTLLPNAGRGCVGRL